MGFDVEQDLFDGCDDADVKEGEKVEVTESKDVLRREWEAAELGVHDSLEIFCNAIGKIVDIDEDDDTVKLRWGNLETSWIPIKACKVTVIYIYIYICIYSIRYQFSKFTVLSISPIFLEYIL